MGWVDLYGCIRVRVGHARSLFEHFRTKVRLLRAKVRSRKHFSVPGRDLRIVQLVSTLPWWSGFHFVPTLHKHLPKLCPPRLNVDNPFEVGLQQLVTPPESVSRLAPVQALYAPPRAPTPLRARSGGTGVPS